MKYCTQCGAENEDGAKFCAECGERLGEAKEAAIQKDKPKHEMGDIMVGMAAGIGARHIAKNLILIGLLIFMMLICLVIAVFVHNSGDDIDDDVVDEMTDAVQVVHENKSAIQRTPVEQAVDDYFAHVEA